MPSSNRFHALYMYHVQILKEQKNTKRSNRVELYKMTPIDIIIILAILMSATGFILWTQLDSLGSIKKNTANIYYDGELLDRIPLDQKKEIALLGGRIVLETQEGSIRVLRSDCPRRLCVQQGWVKHDGVSIICVPFKVIIEIESRHEASVDAVVY